MVLSFWKSMTPSTWKLMKKYQNSKTTLQFSDISEYYFPTAPMVGSNQAGPYPVPILTLCGFSLFSFYASKSLNSITRYKCGH